MQIRSSIIPFKYWTLGAYGLYLRIVILQYLLMTQQASNYCKQNTQQIYIPITSMNINFLLQKMEVLSDSSLS